MASSDGAASAAADSAELVFAIAFTILGLPTNPSEGVAHKRSNSNSDRDCDIDIDRETSCALLAIMVFFFFFEIFVDELVMRLVWSFRMPRASAGVQHHSLTCFDRIFVAKHFVEHCSFKTSSTSTDVRAFA
jgi:hypothetical protein